MIYERQFVKCMDMINQKGIIENTLSYYVTQWTHKLATIACMSVLCVCTELNSCAVFLGRDFSPEETYQSNAKNNN